VDPDPGLVQVVEPVGQAVLGLLASLKPMLQRGIRVETTWARARWECRADDSPSRLGGRVGERGVEHIERLT